MGSYNYVDHLGLKDVCRICWTHFVENRTEQVLTHSCPGLRYFSGSSLPVLLQEASEEICSGNLGISYLKAKILSRRAL